MNPTIYVITFYDFNHGKLRPGKERPLDGRFLENNRNYVYYLIDKELPPALREKKIIQEYELDPDLHAAGGKYFGEWSFLLAEDKYQVCQYPFFMISSRFYEKNHWLYQDLNEEWDSLFSYFDRYDFGYLPSYDRPMRWVNLDWETKLKRKSWEFQFCPFTEKTYELIKNLWGIDIPNDYKFTADLFCNYIGFKDRQQLASYVQFYRPLIDFFFDSEYVLKRDLSPYVRSTGKFRNEKPFTFLLELICHLYFFQKKKNYFALHYDGYYCIDEAHRKIKRLQKFKLSVRLRVRRFFEWQWLRLNTEGVLCRLRAKLRSHALLYATYRGLKALIRK